MFFINLCSFIYKKKDIKMTSICEKVITQSFIDDVEITNSSNFNLE